MRVGVSESTVSVVVNGARSGTRVSETTRAAVLAAAEQLGYRPNQHARSLVLGRSNRIGLYSGRATLDSRNHFYAELLGGMLEASAEFGVTTSAQTANMDDEYLLDLVQTKAVDGLIVHLEHGDRLLKSLADVKVPTVNVADPLPDVPSVCVADAVGGELLARHLYELGHRQVLIKQATDPAQSAIDRVSAFVATATKLGMHTTVTQGDNTSQPLLRDEDLARLTDSRDRVTAIMGWCDIVAERACHQVTQIGLRIPEDVAVVGFDGFQLDFARRFDLTTIRAPWANVGRTAVAKLIALIQGNDVPPLTVLPVDFVRGRTT